MIIVSSLPLFLRHPGTAGGAVGIEFKLGAVEPESTFKPGIQDYEASSHFARDSLYSEPTASASSQVAPSSKAVWVAFANSFAKDFLLNWLAHARKLRAPNVLVGALDEEVETICKRQGVQAKRLRLDGSSLSADSFRQNQEQYRLMGLLKLELVLELLRGGSPVLLSDTDTAWMRDPSAWFELHEDADLFVSSDCLSPSVEAVGTRTSARCGHVLGSVYNLMANTGGNSARCTLG
ncbi:hypothetical protein CYMTET_53846 [Cymbomonas tetramitiformis]|uniref:Nucleotide-diphospho-sugar transferase domain-containing protein n=1 Tax=Cymbomonas tetramitiformis TaxID=36881 RepID=A0AAE0BHI3_9CHLO|nr:hypothetical protein CYMTET_53846 [Cymbomonas tetramitiformis]